MSERYVVTSHRGEDVIRTSSLDEAESYQTVLRGEIRDTHAEVVTA